MFRFSFCRHRRVTWPQYNRQRCLDCGRSRAYILATGRTGPWQADSLPAQHVAGTVPAPQWEYLRVHSTASAKDTAPSHRTPDGTWEAGRVHLTELEVWDAQKIAEVLGEPVWTYATLNDLLLLAAHSAQFASAPPPEPSPEDLAPDVLERLLGPGDDA